MKKIVITGWIVLISFLFSYAQQVPEHNGQWVVDNANMLSEQTESTITALLRAHQDSTSNQVVVLTITSLEGGSLEEFGNRVFNTWKIGQEGRDNGVLLLIAKEDRKVRIEVGYGLEGYLTDLESADIIDHVIIPEFKKGNFDQGVLLGVQAILDAIAGTYEPKNKKESSNEDLIFMIFVMVILFVFSYSFANVKGLAGLGCGISFLLPLLLFSIYVIPPPFNWIIFALLIGLFLYRRIFSKKIDLSRSKGTRGWGGGSWGGGGWSSGGGSSWGGGGFSGGGGSSGGGGASGGW
jgi:uncharacterized protein